VYDLTDFIGTHPGGMAVIQNLSGKDVTVNRKSGTQPKTAWKNRKVSNRWCWLGFSGRTRPNSINSEKYNGLKCIRIAFNNYLRWNFGL
jgi:hypothetical protein